MKEGKWDFPPIREIYKIERYEIRWRKTTKRHRELGLYDIMKSRTWCVVFLWIQYEKMKETFSDIVLQLKYIGTSPYPPHPTLGHIEGHRTFIAMYMHNHSIITHFTLVSHWRTFLHPINSAMSCNFFTFVKTSSSSVQLWTISEFFL